MFAGQGGHFTRKCPLDYKMSFDVIILFRMALSFTFESCPLTRVSSVEKNPQKILASLEVSSQPMPENGEARYDA